MVLRPLSAGAVALLFFIGNAAAQPVSTTSVNWLPGGPVDALERDGNTVYLGGQFSAVAPRSNQIGAFGIFGTPVGRRQCHAPQISGRVSAVTSDGSGGFFVAGRFDRVANSDRHNIVRVLSNCAVDTNWSGIVRGRVNAMTLGSGVLYVGGSFTQAGQQGGGLAPRANLAAFSAANGVIQSWNPGTDGEVHTMDAVNVPSGSTSPINVFIGGSFSQVAGAPRQRLAAIDTNGVATSFVADADAPVLALDVGPTSTPSNLHVWVGGEFTTIGGVSRERIAAINIANGTVDPSFNPGANGRVRAIAFTGTLVSTATLYVGGDFTQMGGAARNFVGSVSSSGVALPFAPNPDGPVHVIAPDSPFGPSVVFIGGRFTQLSGVTRLNAGSVHPTTHAAQEWNPAFNGEVRAIAVAVGFPTRVGVGGDFDAIGALRRQNLAAVKLDTGELLPWSPSVNGPVRTLAVRNGALYVGGEFTVVEGQTRNRLAAFAADSRALSSWNPNADGAVYSVIITGNTVFAAGDFTTLGGTPRSRVAAIDATTGTPTSWTPPAFDAVVRTLAIQSNFLYVGGLFTSVGGAPTPFLVRLNVSSGAHDIAWIPAPNGEVRAICVAPDRIYAGGLFSAIGGATRANLASLNTTTALATLWMPDPNDAVNTLSCASDAIYAGGRFTTVGTGGSIQTRRRLAALTPAASGPTATYATSFDPVSLGIVIAVLRAGDGVAAGTSGDPFIDEPEPVARLAFFADNFAGVPGAPLVPRVVTISGSTRFRWTPPLRGPRPTGYLLEAGTGPGLTNLSGGFPISGTQFDFPVPVGTYYVRFRAMNGFGVGAASDELVLTVVSGFNPCTGPPDPPQDFVATVTGSLVRFSWARGSGETVTGFTLEAGGASGSAEFVLPFGANQTTFEVTAPPGVFYSRIRSTGACGTSAASPEAILLTGGIAAPPSAPRNFTGTSASNTVTLMWSAPLSGTAVSYRLDVGTGPGLNNLASVILGGTSVSFPNVPSGTYYLRLYANGATGVGPASDELILIVP